MKKFFVFMLALVLLITCCACKDKDSADNTSGEAVFPENSSFFGITLDGMTADEAKVAVEEAIAAYVLTVEVGEEKLTYTAEDLNLVANEVDYAELMITEQEDLESELFTYDLSDVQLNLERQNLMREDPENAYLSYDEEQQCFVVNEEVTGTKLNEEVVLAAVESAVKELLPDITILGVDVFAEAEIKADSEEVQAALETANAMLDVSLTYTYSATDETETIGREEIASWLMVGEDGLLVEIVPAQLSAYVSTMQDAHSVSSNTTDFKTTGGSYITVNVASAGQTVDTDALYNDIADCIMNGVSGEREAPYVSSDTDTSSNFGGTYVEINLSAQHLWVYSKGECVVSTDIVSGCVSTGCATPTGLYTIKSKETNRYLVGDGYKSWVNYWMPFNGGIGLHDADGWRSAYGGTIYHYSGSHGCINMPYSAASATYSYVSVGTYVIVYGGVTSVSGQAPSSGTTTTDPCADGHAWGSGKVTSAATCTTAGTTTYTCSDCGKTKTESIAATSHKWGSGNVTSAATCTKAGTTTYTCSDCGETKTESIAMTSHSYSSGVCAVCGAADPTYVPPTVTPPVTPPDSGDTGGTGTGSGEGIGSGTGTGSSEGTGVGSGGDTSSGEGTDTSGGAGSGDGAADGTGLASEVPADSAGNE